MICSGDWKTQRHLARLGRGLLLIRRTLLAAAYLGRVGGPVCLTRRGKGLQQRRGAYVMRLTFSSRDGVATGWDEFNPPRLTAAAITHCTDGQSCHDCDFRETTSCRLAGADSGKFVEVPCPLHCSIHCLWTRCHNSSMEYGKKKVGKESQNRWIGSKRGTGKHARHSLGP
jgi:hypothetical protein